MASPAKTPPSRPVRSRTLLLVDDEPDILESVGDYVELSMPGVKVLRAESGRAGLDVLQTQRVDGIVADFGMAGMDGLQFLVIARRCHPGIPRALLTAHPDAELTRLAHEEADVLDFVPKDVGVDELVHRLAGVLDALPGRPAP